MSTLFLRAADFGSRNSVNFSSVSRFLRAIARSDSCIAFAVRRAQSVFYRQNRERFGISDESSCCIARLSCDKKLGSGWLSLPCTYKRPAANASSAAGLADAFGQPDENGRPSKQNTESLPQNVAPIRSAVPRIERDLVYREKSTGARCLVRKDDRWHLQTPPAAAAPFLPHRRHNCQSQMFRFNPYLFPPISDHLRRLGRPFSSLGRRHA